jgi:hypothetical protein
MRVVIDRFEGTFAVCEAENNTMINIEKSKIPSRAQEGDVLIIEESGIIVDDSSTRKRKEDIRKLMEDVWEN